MRQLSRLEQPPLERHFLALGSEDRRLRFGIGVNDFAVRTYVKRIDFESDAVFGVLDDELQLAGAAHLGRGEGHAELGVSVLPGHRRRGIGGALLGRAHMHARNWGVHALFMHCLTENAAMMHLARKQGMDIVTAAGEADAWLKLPPADAASHMGAVFQQRVALFDSALKRQLANARRIAYALKPGTASRAQGK
ncbi:MAG TPA: GNAT family N-acetyltransferase [Burkholderiales bacterium]|nr:GNAT family N-acetyltransferase [Burkholderiales bacterium]